jgi:hypothetical protein
MTWLATMTNVEVSRDLKRTIMTAPTMCRRTPMTMNALYRRVTLTSSPHPSAAMEAEKT